MPDKAVSEVGHVLFAVGVGLLLWTLAHWVDERFRRGGPDA